VVLGVGGPLPEVSSMPAFVPGSAKVALRSAHGRYLCANDHGGLEWDRKAIGPWEQFNVATVGPNRITLRTAHNKASLFFVQQTLSHFEFGVAVCVRRTGRQGGSQP
jgi:hypothetical protein